MRILYHHRTLGDGAEGVHIAAMVDALRAIGHEVRVISLIGQQTNVTTARTRMLGRLTCHLPRTAYEGMELAYSLVGYRWLTGHIRRWKPDLLYERYTLFNVAGLAAARRAGIPFVLEVNAPLAYERTTYEQLSLRRIARWCERYVCSRADLVAAVSTPLKEYLVRQGVAADRVAVVPNRADPTVFRPNPAARERIRTERGIGPEDVVIGFSGVLRPWHGVELLLEAVARLAQRGCEPHVLIVGDGPSRRDLERRAAERGLSKTTFVGRVPHSVIPEYLAAVDVGVSPRATFYASPMKIPEYMAMEMVVVAPRMPNIQDLIADGIDGLLFTPEAPESLASVLDAVCRDPERRRRLAESARQSILAGRTWQHNAASIPRLIGATCSGPRPAQDVVFAPPAAPPNSE